MAGVATRQATTHVLRSLGLTVTRRPTARFSSAALTWLDTFKNHERTGVPSGAGTDSAAGFDLLRMTDVLEALGQPHRAWPAIHVAGTKGKGSIVSMLTHILKASGYSVGTYTSPHVTSIYERIAINGQPISPSDFEKLVHQCRPSIEATHAAHGGALTYFEVFTALAFKYFADVGVATAVVEAGLGGARDATNVLRPDNVVASIISVVGHDHADALGGNIGSIAAAKAGIMKPNRPVIIARQNEMEVIDVLLKHAAELECLTLRAEEHVAWEAGPVQLQESRNGSRRPVAYQTASLKLSGWAAKALHNAAAMPLQVRMQLVGKHQLDNAAAAVTAVACLRAENEESYGKITAGTITAGLEEASLPGRFEVRRLAGAGHTAGPWVIIDGSHTPESSEALIETIKETFPERRTLAVVLAMADDKDALGICTELRALGPVAIVFTQVDIAGARSRAAAPGKLVAAWQSSARKAGRPSGMTRTRELIKSSLSAATEAAAREVQAHAGNPPGIVVITGSLHAAAAALRQLDFTTES